MKRGLLRYTELLAAAPPGLVSAGDLARLPDHVDDALCAAQLLLREAVTHLVDIGSGAGLPGLPISIELEHIRVDLIESKGRKCAFLEAAVADLNLSSRVRVHHMRAEHAPQSVGRELADCATARALASGELLLEYLAPFVRVGGGVLAWTTPDGMGVPVRPEVLELLGLGDPVVTPAPSLLRDRGLLAWWPKLAPTTGRVPRRPGVARKRSLCP